MIIKIDNRETSRHCTAVRYYSPNHKIIIEELPIGDFIFTDNKTEVVFEYKSYYDFKNSVNEGRIFDQALRQHDNFKHHFIIVECENDKKNNLFDSEKNCEVFASLNTFTTVITCPSLRIALRMMEKQAESCFENHPFNKKPYDKIDNVAYNYLLLIDGIDKIKAHTICKRLKLKTFEDLKNVTTKKLLKVSGIGPITAQRITKSLKLS